MNRTHGITVAAMMLCLTAVLAIGAMAETKKVVAHSDAGRMGAAELGFPENGVVRVPFRRGDRNHVLLDAIDSRGNKVTFALDTGASFSVLTPNYTKLRSAAEPDGETDGAQVETGVQAIGAHGAGKSIGGPSCRRQQGLIL